MRVATFLHLDCAPVIPECGYQCASCIQEIQSVLGRIHGVCEVSLGEREGTSGIIVQYESETATDDQLIGVVNTLPSFHRGRFVASAVELRPSDESPRLPEA
jgi:copper chaperone CopZ